MQKINRQINTHPYSQEGCSFFFNYSKYAFLIWQNQDKSEVNFTPQEHTEEKWWDFSFDFIYSNQEWKYYEKDSDLESEGQILVPLNSSSFLDNDKIFFILMYLQNEITNSIF